MKKKFSVLIFMVALIACAGNEITAQNLQTKEFEMKGCIRLFGKDDFVIRSQDELLKAVRNDDSRKSCLETLDKIDFSKNSLLGTNLNTGYCGYPLGLKHQAVKIKRDKIFSVNITYAEPRGTCRAMSSYNLWLLVPKIPAAYEVKFGVKAVPHW